MQEAHVNRRCNAFTGKSQVKIMNWLIKKVLPNPIAQQDDILQILTQYLKGETVQESRPQRISYYWEQPKSKLRPTMIRMEIFDCSADEVPLYKTDGKCTYP